MEHEHSSPHGTTVKYENSNEPHAYYDSYDDASNSANNSYEPHAFYDSPNEASTVEDISFEGHAYYD